MQFSLSMKVHFFLSSHLSGLSGVFLDFCHRLQGKQGFTFCASSLHLFHSLIFPFPDCSLHFSVSLRVSQNRHGYWCSPFSICWTSCLIFPSSSFCCFFFVTIPEWLFFFCLLIILISFTFHLFSRTNEFRWLCRRKQLHIPVNWRGTWNFLKTIQHINRKIKAHTWTIVVNWPEIWIIYFQQRWRTVRKDRGMLITFNHWCVVLPVALSCKKILVQSLF